MRSGYVSYAAMIAAATLALASPLIAQAPATDPVQAMPPPVATNWPPTPPPLTAPVAEPATTSAPVVAAPAAAPIVPAPMPPPVATNWPPTPPPLSIDKAPTSPPSTATAVAPAAPATPVFALAADLTARLRADKSDAVKADRDAALKFYDARAGAPVWVTAKGYTDGAIALMTEVKNADSYGLQSSAFRLPAQTFSGSPSNTDLADAEATLMLAALKYARHARGGRLDPVALTPVFDRKPQVVAPDGLIGELAASSKPGDYLRGLHPRHPQFEKLRLKYVAVRSGQSVLPPAPPEPVVEVQPGKKAAPPKKQAAAPTPAQLEKKLLANMEMYRWMPDMGDTFVQNNIPEFMTRTVRGGKLVHTERIIVGKSDTPTPIFSDEFELVVFRPFWNVPDSIKWKELQPQLERAPFALDKVGLKAAYNGKEVDPRAVNWQQTDLRAFHVYQPPGPTNALGQVKFLFPNKHDVYMHDTPTKPLFNNASRAYSHGCMRVRDPLKFAEMLLAADKGWSMDQVRKLANDGPDNNEIKLSKKLPIHITYFTTQVDDDGTLKLFSDIYSHEQKIHLGLEGKAHLIQQPAIVADKAPPKKSTQIVQRETSSSLFGGPSTKSSGNPFETWMKNVLNF